MVKRRILLLEDDPHVQADIVRTLRPNTVTCAATVAEGTKIGAGIDPELVICDYYLADGNGRDALRSLRDQGVTAPVLLISGDITHDDWIEWAAALSDDFLPKPFNATSLKQKVQRLLAIDATARETIVQHTELAAVAARDAREAAAANLLLERMLQRGTFDPKSVRVDQIMAGRFGGDAVCGAQVGARYRWLVGDVSGHTLSSALVTIPLSMLFYSGCADGLPLAEHITSINNQLGALLPTSMFSAAAILELDREAGTLAVWNGGAPDVVIRSGDGPLRRFASTDPMLAVIRDPAFVPEIVTTPVTCGDRVFVFTDGLIEANIDDGSLLGLEAICEEIAGGSADEAFQRVSQLWRRHSLIPGAPDDMTLVEVLV